VIGYEDSQGTVRDLQRVAVGRVVDGRVSRFDGAPQSGVWVDKVCRVIMDCSGGVAGVVRSDGNLEEVPGGTACSSERRDGLVVDAAGTVLGSALDSFAVGQAVVSEGGAVVGEIGSDGVVLDEAGACLLKDRPRLNISSGVRFVPWASLGELTGERLKADEPWSRANILDKHEVLIVTGEVNAEFLGCLRVRRDE
jgi:hypothetical protein